MGDWELRLSSATELPPCCQHCLRLAYESIELSDDAIFWCNAGIMFPQKKGTCKRQLLAKETQ